VRARRGVCCVHGVEAIRKNQALTGAWVVKPS
jgi:hypothetical protein